MKNLIFLKGVRILNIAEKVITVAEVVMFGIICMTKKIIEKYLVIGVGGKITQNYLDVTKEAEQFLKE